MTARLDNTWEGMREFTGKKIESGRKCWATNKCQQKAHDCREIGVSPIVTATGMQIEKVEDFCYLGSVISNNIRSARI